MTELTKDEQKILQLYHECESVSFYQFNRPLLKAKKFVGILDTPQTINDDDRQSVFVLSSVYKNNKVISACVSVPVVKANEKA